MMVSSKFFCDDGNICASHEIMLEVIEFINQRGPSYGYFIKLSKGSYLLGRCGSYATAVARKNNDGTFELVQHRVVGERHLKMVLRALGEKRLIDAIAFNTSTAQWPDATRQVNVA